MAIRVQRATRAIPESGHKNRLVAVCDPVRESADSFAAGDFAWLVKGTFDAVTGNGVSDFEQLILGAKHHAIELNCLCKKCADDVQEDVIMSQLIVRDKRRID